MFEKGLKHVETNKIDNLTAEKSLIFFDYNTFDASESGDVSELVWFAKHIQSNVLGEL